jgi:hypothetical protein
MTESILIILKSYRCNSQSTGRIKIFCFCIFWWTIFWRSSASDGLQSLKSLASEYASERESWIASEDPLMFFGASSIASLLHCSLNFYLMILHTRTIISNTNCYFNIVIIKTNYPLGECCQTHFVPTNIPSVFRCNIFYFMFNLFRIGHRVPSAILLFFYKKV